MLKRVFLFLVILLVATTISCASAPKLTVVTPMGEPVPEPHYVMKDLGGAIQVTFWFKAVGWVEDLDRTRQPNPVFIVRNGKHHFSTEKYDRLMLIMKVYNPRNIKYNIFTRQAVEYKGGGDVASLSQVAASDLQFRSHEFYLPFGKGTKSVKVSYEIQKDDGSTLIRTGNFNYSVN